MRLSIASAHRSALERLSWEPSLRAEAPKAVPSESAGASDVEGDCRPGPAWRSRSL
jgi:hypothetical protein